MTTTIEELRKIEWPKEKISPDNPSVVLAGRFVACKENAMEERIEALNILGRASGKEHVEKKEKDVMEFTNRSEASHGLYEIVKVAQQKEIHFRIMHQNDFFKVYLKDVLMCDGSQELCSYYVSGFIDGHLAQGHI